MVHAPKTLAPRLEDGVVLMILSCRKVVFKIAGSRKSRVLPPFVALLR
jgi:hypothetical protein